MMAEMALPPTVHERVDGRLIFGHVMYFNLLIFGHVISTVLKYVKPSSNPFSIFTVFRICYIVFFNLFCNGVNVHFIFASV